MSGIVAGISSVVAQKGIEKVEQYASGDWNTNDFFGHRRPGDKLLFSKKIRKTGTYFNWSLRHVVEIPFSSKNIITYIEAIDQWQDGTGGNVEFKKGGIGKNHVVIVLTSQKMRGMAFDVNIYGI